MSVSKRMLIVGLGNYTHPGTRHNIGMMVVDKLAQQLNASWTKKAGWQSEVATANVTIKLPKKKVKVPAAAKMNKDIKSTTEQSVGSSITTDQESGIKPIPVVLTPVIPKEPTTMKIEITMIKPLLLMNVCGSSVSKAAKDLGIKPQDIVVIHDDMERDIGKLSFKSTGSANGHNGVKSCISSLGTQQFKRLRVGIGRPSVDDRSPKLIAGYVLGRFKPLEVVKLEELVYPLANDELLRVSAEPV